MSPSIVTALNVSTTPRAISACSASRSAAVVASFYIRFEAAGLMEREKPLLLFSPTQPQHSTEFFCGEISREDVPDLVQGKSEIAQR